MINYPFLSIILIQSQPPDVALIISKHQIFYHFACICPLGTGYSLISFGFSLCVTQKQVDELLDAVDRTFTKWEKKIGRKGCRATTYDRYVCSIRPHGRISFLNHTFERKQDADIIRAALCSNLSRSGLTPDYL